MQNAMDVRSWQRRDVNHHAHVSQLGRILGEFGMSLSWLSCALRLAIPLHTLKHVVYDIELADAKVCLWVVFKDGRPHRLADESLIPFIFV